MNIIAVIILVTLIGSYFLEIFADVLNLGRMDGKVPDSFRKDYDPEKYRKSQIYLKVNTHFGWVRNTFALLVLLIFWFSGGFAFTDKLVRSIGYGPIVSGLAFIGILLVFKSVLSLPFDIYHTFVIEERFGFNKTTAGTYVLDLLKTIALSIVLGVPILSAILWFFIHAGANAWWYCWVAVTAFMLLIQYIAPRWIMPLFNEFIPLEPGKLKTAIFAYANSIGFSLENVYVMDGSRRSSKSNAFFTGFGKNKRIVLFDTLIERHDVGELVAILAHEMGHYKKKHILEMLAMSICQTGLMLFLLSFFITHEQLFRAFYLENVSVYAGLVFFGMLYAPLDLFLGLFSLARSRNNEYEADRFAIETARTPFSFIQALKKLTVDNLSNLKPHPLYVFLHYSHPPILKRIEGIDRFRHKLDG